MLLYAYDKEENEGKKEEAFKTIFEIIRFFVSIDVFIPPEDILNKYNEVLDDWKDTKISDTVTEAVAQKLYISFLETFLKGLKGEIQSEKAARDLLVSTKMAEILGEPIKSYFYSYLEQHQTP